MKRLCYRGMFYKYAQPPMQHLQSKTSSQSMQVMCYRGVFYLRDVRSSNPKSPCSGVVFLPNNSTPRQGFAEGTEWKQNQIKS